MVKSGTLKNLYGQSLSLLTDLYQLTMAYGYFKSGLADREAVFHLFFRKNPFAGGYAIACGLAHVVDFLEDLTLRSDDLDYLATLTGNDGQPLFGRDFLEHLRGMRFSCDIDAIPEGTAVFPHEPLIRVKGPLLQAQIIETPLLNLVNFQTLIATKAARICQAAAGEPVLEFGLRRAQGIDGGLGASRAAYVGGCAATSNVLAGKIFGIPVKGTHAHSWVMAFDSEPEAFAAYARAMPNNCVFLVDTYDTIEGVRRAAQIGAELRRDGHELVGVRLDSGDLAYLSLEARRILDEAGFPQAAIVASNDLDETLIASLKQQGAKITVWGVGTKLATAYDQPALGGVYKLAAIRDGGRWLHRVKLSEQAVKVSNPGILQVRRYDLGERLLGDVIYDELTGLSEPCDMIDPMDPTRRRHMGDASSSSDLLVPVFRGGERCYELPPLTAVRDRTARQLGSLHRGIKRFLNPHSYPVGLEARLHALKHQLILQARGQAEDE